VDDVCHRGGLMYEKLWGELEALTSWDAEAREHIEQIAADYRGLRK
jgi:hypothetical protein